MANGHLSMIKRRNSLVVPFPLTNVTTCGSTFKFLLILRFIGDLPSLVLDPGQSMAGMTMWEVGRDDDVGGVRSAE